MNILDILGKKLLIWDGGMGTLLQAKGLKGGELPERWNLDRSQDILDVHTEYLEAGADIITTNSFSCTKYKLAGTTLSVSEATSAAVGLAVKAIKDFEVSHPESGCHYVALDVGPTGRLLKPMGELEFDDAVNAFKEEISAGVQAGADFILCETFTDNYEMKAAVIAARECCSLPVIVSMAVDENGRLLTGGDIESAVTMLEALGVNAIGMNCGFGPEQFIRFLPEFLSACSLPILMQPNAGLPRVENGHTVFDVTPDEFALSAKELVSNGVAAIGGCCGTTPAHIAAVAETCRNMAVVPVITKNTTVISSYSHAVHFGERPLLVGERINPTGKKLLKQALRDNDISYICDEAVREEEAGADILDVNVGLPEIDECKMMEECIYAITAISDLPLQIDTADIPTMERALRIYNGKPLLNSVNGKKESMEAVFPLAKKYGAAIVCLTLDENGIPETTDERIAIAEKIISCAAEYGIEKKDLIFDALTMTISTNDNNGLITLNAVRRLRYELGVNTILGVSNVSFGLPLRSLITTTFFTMCLANGLSSGIINPLDERLMSAYDSYLTVAGYDRQCLKYLDKYSGKTDVYQKTPGTAPVSGNTSAAPASDSHTHSELQTACIRGLSEKAALLTAEALKKEDPLKIIDSELIPALNYVGIQFESKRMFLPQLLMSADAAKAAFAEIKSYFNNLGQVRTSKGSIVLATVKGDVHDIGKNIVKVLLENYEYEVIDLGKDVDPEIILQTVLEKNIRLVGLSALMTTTVVNMENTIKLLHEKAPDTKIVVGGAVLTAEYAKQIKADCYAADAMATVRYANEIFG